MEHRNGLRATDHLLVEDQHGRALDSAECRVEGRGFSRLNSRDRRKARVFCGGFEGQVDVLLTDVGLNAPQCWSSDGSTEPIIHGVSRARAAVKKALLAVVFTLRFMDL